MKKKIAIRVIYTCFLLILGVIGVKGQQDVQFSQYVFNGIILNPGYTGYREATNFNILYRDQWTGLEGSPKTLTASIDGVSRSRNIGLGLYVVNDKLGVERNLSAFANFAYRVRINEESRLSFGLAAGLAQYTVDGTLYNFSAPDPNSLIKQSVINPDLNFGIFYASYNYFWGLSVTDLFSNAQKNLSSSLYLYRVRHYYGQFGAIYDLNDNLSIKPSILVKEDFRGPTNADFNLFFLLGRKLWLGGSYRTGLILFNQKNLQSDLSTKDAISGLMEFNLNEHWRLGYSFDYATSHLQQVSNGSHEISLGYTFYKRNSPMLTPRVL
jgi:type IX secretion system PorP/SprF family membrane protein